jgi:CBS domain-containing protein
MQVREIMTGDVRCVPPETTLQEAARQMRDLDVGPLPICDHDRLSGVVTDRDIAVRAVADGRDPKTTPVSEVMTERVTYCFDDDDVDDCAKLMKDKQIRRILVVNRDKRLVGIVSLKDLALEGHDDKLSAKTLEAVSQPVH